MLRMVGQTAATCFVVGSIVVLSAQGPPAGAQPPGPQGGNPTATFPAQQRALAAPAVIERGGGLYGVYCRACHGADLRGGELGGPNLLRSQLALNDRSGELIGPVITDGRQTPGMRGMPPIGLPPEDITAIAAYIHSVHASMRGQGSPPASAPVALNIVVGDPQAGQAYFATHCSACHSPGGDLQGLASRVADPVQLQNLWVSGGRGGRGGRGRGGPPPGSLDRRQVTVAVTLPGGERVEGRLDRIDDFMVLLTTADGVQRSFGRRGDVPEVIVRDPLEPHRRLLAVYTDRDIHDLTAYLVTLK